MVADLKRRGLKFSHADLGDSDKMQPGDPVYAVGTPYGLTRTVTRGIIMSITTMPTSPATAAQAPLSPSCVARTS